MTTQTQGRLHSPPVSPLGLFRNYSADWRSKNVQPTWPEGIDKQLLYEDSFYLDVRLHETPRPICPHYQLIGIVGLLVGISLEELAKEPHFCGCWHEYEYHSGCFGGNKEYGAIRAASACATIMAELTRQLLIFDRSIKEPPLPSLEMADEEVELDQAIDQLKKRRDARKLRQQRKEILNRWRAEVFALTCVPNTSRSRDPHFRRFSAADRLTDREITSKVRSLRDALQHQVVGEPDKLWGGPSAAHCPVAPESDLSRHSFRHHRW